jgi:hypothetical protein
MFNHYRRGTRFRRLLARAIARKWDRWEDWMGQAQRSGDSRFPSDIQEAVTAYMETNCWYRWLPCETEIARLDLERRCIGSIVRCGSCGPSPGWLGQYAFELTVRESGLWNSQHVGGKFQLGEEGLKWTEQLVDIALRKA